MKIITPKKFLTLYFTFIALLVTSAQNKNITDEPQWSMNIYFEDATDATDVLKINDSTIKIINNDFYTTVFIYYNSLASNPR